MRSFVEKMDEHGKKRKLWIRRKKLVSALWDPGRESGAVAEQGALQQAFRGGGGTACRERSGAPCDTADESGGERSDGQESSLKMALASEGLFASSGIDYVNMFRRRLPVDWYLVAIQIQSGKIRARLPIL